MSAIISKKKGSVLTLELNRPKVINALDENIFENLLEVLVKPPGSISALILKGSGEKGFSAGADLKALAKMSVDQVSRYLELAHETINALENYPRPTIGMLHGYVLGGGLELALGCDFLIAEEKSIFAMPEARLGLIPGFQGEKRLKARIGATKAKEMVFTGKKYTAQEALSLKLIDAVAKSDFMDQILKLHLTSFAPNLASAKEAFNTDNTLPLFIECFKKMDWKKRNK